MAERSIFPLQQAAQTALDVPKCQQSLRRSSFYLDSIVTNALWPAARRQGKGTKYVTPIPSSPSFCTSSHR